MNLRHVRFRQAVLNVAAPINGVDKDRLNGEDMRRMARVLRALIGAGVPNERGTRSPPFRLQTWRVADSTPLRTIELGSAIPFV